MIMRFGSEDELSLGATQFENQQVSSSLNTLLKTRAMLLRFLLTQLMMIPSPLSVS
jgi:hypothetical protein